MVKRSLPHDNPGRKKISETFLRFAAPILSALPEEATPSEIERGLTLPWTVWNAVVFDHANGTDQYIKLLLGTLAHSPVAVALAEDLIDRKRRLFADDNRLIGEYRVTKPSPGELNLWAEARQPFAVGPGSEKPNRTGAGDA